MFKPARHAMNPPALLTRANTFFALAIACVGMLVAIRAGLDGSRGDHFSMIAGLAFLALLAWRGISITSSSEMGYQEVVLIPAAIFWATLMAYRGADLACWWSPAILLMVFLSPSSLMLAVLAASVVMTTAGALLGQGTNAAFQVSIATLTTGLCAVCYRLAKRAGEVTERTRANQLSLIVDAAKLAFAEVSERGDILRFSDPLLLKLGIPRDMRAWRLLDLIHPNDHACTARAQQRVLDAESGVVVSGASCDCRLLHSDGSGVWVRAQFSRAALPSEVFLVTFSDIDDLVRAEEALRDSQRKLNSQAHELATQFEAAKKTLHARQEVERLAQHDLKSPLKSIEAAASLLRKGRTLSTSEDKLLTSIERTAGRALAIVSMSLDLYRMEEGTFRFVPETIDLVTIGRQVISELGRHARSKNVRLEFTGASNSLHAIGNEGLTLSVLENLVRNALEAAPEHSVVRLALHEGTRVGVLIHNEGEVPAAIRDVFFEKYVTHGKRDGLGLGTYSARLIARAQGGDLTMSSSASNGTMLALQLRRAQDNADTAQANEAMPDELVDLPESARHSNAEPMDVLVVEDDEHNWLLLLSWLPAHVGARRAVNGREAIDALVTRRPDLVVMDLEMPVMDGFEALGRIREMQSSAGEEASVVVAFTGYDDPETSAKIHQAGFDGILPKPVTKEAFDRIMASVNRQSILHPLEEVWVEKKFVDAFPAFIDSRRALVDDIERAADGGDLATAKRAAHTLAGSPAIHGFDSGIRICRQIIASSHQMDNSDLAGLVSDLRKLLSSPSVR